MRVRISLRCEEKDAFVPFNYNALVHAMILDKIRKVDAEYSSILHDSTNFKFFTFSELMIPRGKADRKRGGIIIFSDTIGLFISSPDRRFIAALVSGMQADPKAQIGSCGFFIESVNAEPVHDFSSGRVFFRTISPVVASTKREAGGILRTWDLLPHEPQFYSNIEKNLLRKFEEFSGSKQPVGPISIRHVRQLRTRRIRIKDDFHIGSMMAFEAEGNNELLNFAYECGFGERNSMGFGMVRVT